MFPFLITWPNGVAVTHTCHPCWVIVQISCKSDSWNIYISSPLLPVFENY